MNVSVGTSWQALHPRRCLSHSAAALVDGKQQCLGASAWGLPGRAQLVPALREGRVEQCSADISLHSLNSMSLFRLQLPKAGLLPNSGTQ